RAPAMASEWSQAIRAGGVRVSASPHRGPVLLSDPRAPLGLRGSCRARRLRGTHPDLGDEATNDGGESQAPIKEDRRRVSARYICHIYVSSPGTAPVSGEARN